MTTTNPSPPSQKNKLNALLFTQFFGAFNDNVFKMMLGLMLASAAIKTKLQATTNTNLSPEALTALKESTSQAQVTLAFVVFTIPLVLFSIPAGVWADRWSKRKLIISTKILELIIMTAATLSFFIAPNQLYIPLALLGLMGVQSALFSPAKYGILPELLTHQQLTNGNAKIELWTFVAIVTGSAAGGLLLDITQNQTFIAIILLSALALVGLIASIRIPHTPPARPNAKLTETFVGSISAIKNDRVLKLAVLGSVVYWAIASLFSQDILVYTKSLSANFSNPDTFAGIPLAIMGIGIGIGALLAARLSKNQVEYGILPLGTLGLTLFAAILGITAPNYTITCILMIPIGICSGLIVVPLNTLLQWRAPDDRRGAVIATANALIFAGIMLGSLTAYFLSLNEVSTTGILIAAAAALLASSLWAIYLLPEALLRLIFVLATHTIYKLKIVNPQSIPTTGGALLTPNHVSLIDGFLIMASTDRPVRFIVDESYYNKPWARPLFKAAGAIPISSTGGPRQMLSALRNAGDYLDQGDLVCIFPEGQITRTGMTMPFRRGITRIAKGRNVPIIPVHLDRVWGSIFSFNDGRFLKKIPQQIPYPITVSFGEHLPNDATPFQIRQAVMALSTAAWEQRMTARPPLHHTFIKTARSRPFRLAFADESRTSSRIATLTGAIALAHKLIPQWRDQQNVGLLLPPSVPSSIANLAAALAGKTSVNLNYTTGPAGLAAAANQASLKTILTSRTFIQKAKLTLPDGPTPIYLEDLSPTITTFNKLAATFHAFFAPLRVIEKYAGATRPVLITDPATIIFSSGSTGEPKGVILTHKNIDANVEGAAQVFHVTSQDTLLGILPMFHSFGYMTLWFAANRGFATASHANPLDADAITNLISKFNITTIIATPTFLQLYLRRFDPAALASVRLVLTGAEKLPDRLTIAFEEKFGIRPMEGYGATECAPIVALSTLDVRYSGVYQSGSRRGSVGQPLPGITTKIINPDTPEDSTPLPPNTPGMLLVKGPNIMQGYLNRPDLTAEAIKDNWYITGDIALIDDDGFIKITDRLSRFSKIGGEMVPHGKVEDALHEAANATTQTFAVTAIPDEKKGERLAVLHTLTPNKIPPLTKALTTMGLPNLFIPRPDQFIQVDQLPTLGTGKLDLKALKQIAADKLLN